MNNNIKKKEQGHNSINLPLILCFYSTFFVKVNIQNKFAQFSLKILRGCVSESYNLKKLNKSTKTCGSSNQSFRLCTCCYVSYLLRFS